MLLSLLSFDLIFFYSASASSTLIGRGLFSKDNAEVETLVDNCCLEVLKDTINLVDFHSFRSIEQLVDEVSNGEYLLILIRGGPFSSVGVILLSDHVKEELQDITILLDARFIEGLDELFFANVPVALFIH